MPTSHEAIVERILSHYMLRNSDDISSANNNNNNNNNNNINYNNVGVSTQFQLLPADLRIHSRDWIAYTYGNLIGSAKKLSPRAIAISLA